MVEYALLVVFIALVAVVGANILGISIKNLFTNIGTSLDAVSPPTLPTPGS